MHNQWLDLIPYYVAGTASHTKAAALEQHLARCAACRQALDEWQQVAGLVRAEAQQWAGLTPSLGQDMRARLFHLWGPSANGHSRPVAAVGESTQVVRQPRHRPPQTQLRRFAIPVTLAAALMGVVMVGLLLLYISTRGDESPKEQLSAGGDNATLSFTIQTGTPTRTPFATPLATQPGLPTAAVAPNVIALNPSRMPPRPLYSPTPRPTDYFMPTPTSRFEAAWGQGYVLITLEQVGNIPAGTRVRLNATWYDGFQRWCTIVSEDERLSADARESQLAYAGGYPPPNATPVPSYHYYIGTGGFEMMTLEQIDNIPSGTSVTITYGYYNGVTWVYGIVDWNMRSAEAREYQLIVGPGPGLTPTPTPTAIAPPQILSFTADRSSAVAGQTLTLSWQVSGAQSVRLMDYNLIAPPYSSLMFDNLTPYGSTFFTVAMPDSYSYTDQRAYQLVMVDYMGNLVEGSSSNGGIITLPLACPFDYFFGRVPGSCPEYPLPTPAPARFQPFENGFMTGLPVTGGTNVYVLYNDGNWTNMVASNTLPDTPETPPAGFYQPFGAFGMVWNSGDVRSRLGWATAAESSYTASWQNEARNTPTEKTAIRFYLSLPDGRISFVVPQTMGSPGYGTWTTP